MKRFIACAAILALVGIGASAPTAADAQSFSIDDNPSAPIIGFPGFGFGAEDPYGMLPFPLAPSPSLPLVGASGDGAILAPGPVVHHPGPNGFYLDALSTIKKDLGLPIRLLFSVDRVSLGMAASAVGVEAAFNQQPADIYASTDFFVSPGAFVGLPPGPPYAGVLPAPLGGAASNTLLLDDSALGLLAGFAVVPPGVPAPPIAFGTHDNVDALDLVLVDAAPPDGLFDMWSYFTVYPDEAAAVPVPLGGPISPSDIIDVPAGAGGGVPAPPFAPAVAMGLDVVGGPFSDSIDALIVFDNNIPGGPAYGGPGAEPAVDYALFSLAPGSASLVAFGLDAADVFFTDFTGAFALYAPSWTLGLAGAPGGAVGLGDSIDALDFTVCGDGTIQLGEQCDDGPANGTPASCCDATCNFKPAGTPCTDDGNACSVDECDGAGVCAHLVQPATTCLAPLKASFQVKDNADDAKDQIKWKWLKGPAVTQADLDDPSATATYTLCVYDESAGVPSLATSIVVPPNATWLDKDPKGWQYKDKLGSVDGVVKLQLKPGDAGKPKAQLKAKGVNVPMPAPFSVTEFFDQDTKVTAQLFNSDTGVCWTTEFTTATKNTAEQFKAKTP